MAYERVTCHSCYPHDFLIWNGYTSVWTLSLPEQNWCGTLGWGWGWGEETFIPRTPLTEVVEQVPKTPSRVLKLAIPRLSLFFLGRWLRVIEWLKQQGSPNSRWHPHHPSRTAELEAPQWVFKSSPRQGSPPVNRTLNLSGWPFNYVWDLLVSVGLI